MKIRGLLILSFALLLTCPARIQAAPDTTRHNARYIFASDTAEKFVTEFFTGREAGAMTNLTLPDDTQEEFLITLEEYRKVFLEKGLGRKRYVNVTVAKTIEPEQDKAYCYLSVKITPPMFSSRPRSVYALRTLCRRAGGEWKVAPDMDESAVVPQPFSVLYSKKMKRGHYIRTAERQAAEIISLDAEKMLAVARYVQNLLQKAKIESTYGDSAAAAETYRKILAMEPEHEAALQGLESCAETEGQPLPQKVSRSKAAAPAPARAPVGDYITKADFDNKINELMGKMSAAGPATGGRESREFVTQDEIDRKLEAIISKLRENPPAAPQQPAAAPEDEHEAMVERIIALGEKLLHEGEYRRAIVEFQKAETVDPGNKRASMMANLCRKALEME